MNFANLASFAVAIIFSCSTQQLAIAGDATFTVISCNDGDTCRVSDSNGETVKVRLVGIDAPETRGSKRKHKGRQPFSLEAKAFLNSQVAGKKVILKSYGTDAFGRVLGDLMIEDKSANLSLVREGLAECYRGKPPKGYDTSQCVAAQLYAKQAKRGIWSLENYESPKEFRKK